MGSPHIRGVFLIDSFILIFLINYIFIYYKQYLFAFIFLIDAILQGEYLLFLIVIAVVISFLFSNDKSKQDTNV